MGVDFAGVVALSPVSFSVSEGEAVALMGPSGSGKSTLLGVVDGLITPTRGHVLITPSPTSKDKPEWIFQSSPMLLRRTVVDNTVLGAIARGEEVKTAFNRAETTLTALGLQDRLYAPVFSLSGGEKQRVAIARSIVSRAPIILADEPTASLDVGARQLVVDALRAAAVGGAAVVVATHDVHVAHSCDRIVRLDAEDPRFLAGAPS